MRAASLSLYTDKPCANAVTCGLSLRELYRDASAPQYSQTRDGKDICQALKTRIRAADISVVSGLLRKLLDLSEGRKGALRFAEEIRAAKVIIQSRIRHETAVSQMQHGFHKLAWKSAQQMRQSHELHSWCLLQSPLRQLRNAWSLQYAWTSAKSWKLHSL